MMAWQQLGTFRVRQRRTTQRAARLGTALALALALILAALAAEPAAAGPTVACPNTQIQPQCIDNLVVTPHGTYADISFFTTTAKLSTVTVSTVAPNKQADGTWSYAGVPTVFFTISPATNKHAVQVPDLETHHTYHYLISATKAAIGNDAQKTGSFTTLTRHVSVTFTSIHVTDDSDYASAGDLTFWFFAAGWLPFTSDGALLTYPLDGSEASISSGDTVPLPANQYRTEIAPAPDAIVLKVSGRDDDCDFGQFCVEGIGPHDSGGGSDSENDWATAETKLIKLAYSGLGEGFSTSISWGTGDYSLKFEVAATIKVWYA